MMKICPINNAQYNTNFNATIVPTKEWNNYLKYVNEHAFKELGCHDTIKDKALIDRVIKAIEANPSKAKISFDVFYRKNESVNARGVVRSQYDKLTDTEPAFSDSYIPIENIIRRIFHPDNRMQMCKLFGAVKDVYAVMEQNTWWDEHISPIWPEIREVFFEKNVYDRGDEMYLNERFREENPVFEGDD